MKIKEDMYVRTKQGKIGKIIDINLGQEEKRYILDSSSVYIYCEEDISKASHNIIDLIQSKDLIVDTKNNLYVVDRVEGDYVFTTSKNEYGLIITLVDYQIKSIVTKEQFESMKYSLEG